MNPLPNYPGSKEGSGVDKRLVSLMPPHRTYIEGFLGGGALLRRKRPAALSIGIDLDPTVIAAWLPAATPGLTLTAALAGNDVARASVKPARGDDHSPGGIASKGVAQNRLCIARADFLHLVDSPLAPILQDPNTLIYVDPPYLGHTRTRLFYTCEMANPIQHARLLRLLRALPCMVMISHYPCPIYDHLLKDWRRIQYRCQTRGGPRQEACWLNFPEPATLHDVRFAGDGYRERERIKRKSRRWRAMLAKMPAAERQFVREALDSLDRPSMEAALLPGHSAELAAHGEAVRLAGNDVSRGHRHGW